MNAAMSARMVAHVFRRKTRRLAAPARPPRPALAGHARSLSHLARGSDAAADAGRCGDSLLRALPENFSGCERFGCGVAGRSPASLERVRLLREREESASGGEADRVRKSF